MNRLLRNRISRADQQSLYGSLPETRTAFTTMDGWLRHQPILDMVSLLVFGSNINLSGRPTLALYSGSVQLYLSIT